MKGCYILVVNIPEDTAIKVGSLGTLPFQEGYYAYVGSAMNGLEQRIGRHLRKKKAIRWHIDYILQYGTVHCALIKENDLKEECMISNALEKKFQPIRSFGSSDCSCSSHLYRIGGMRKFKGLVKDMGFNIYFSSND